MKLDLEAFQRGMWPEGLVAALATMAVAWPLTSLLREETWLLPALSMVALVAIVGAILRTIDAPPSLIALGQLFVGLAGIAALFLRDTLWRGFLPTSATLAEVGALLRQAGTVLQTYAAPAPTTEGVSFLVVAVLTLTAVSVDSMGVTGRAPASAGIPLAAGFLVSVSNSGEAMPPWYFAAIAGLWLVMLAQQDHRVTAAWPSDRRRESKGGEDVSSGVPHHRGLAQTLGGLALVGAVLGAAVIPHLPPTFFGDGLARNTQARGPAGDTAEVAFTETMDPTKDLKSRSEAPILTYRTTATRLEPLRVTSTERWEDGKWVAPARDAFGLLPVGAPLPRPDGLSPDVTVQEQRMTVTGNALPPPYLAIPSPPATIDLNGTSSYRFDPRDDTVVLQNESPRYQVSYLGIPSGSQLPDGTGAPLENTDGFDAELLDIDDITKGSIADLTDEIVGEETNTLAQAVRIQTHLRSSEYRYSLELAPAARDTAADPIGGFLATKQGYCVQFATTMVMMARYEGIPARMAVGFLPGTVQVDGTRKVVAANAHTWPELWIEGLGWTRFEPTPGLHSGQPPAYASNPNQDDSGATTSTAIKSVTPTPTATPAAPGDPSFLDTLGEILKVLARVLLGALALALLLMVVPIVGRRYRGEGVHAAESLADEIEGQWLLLTRSLRDLGVDDPPERSPRDMGRHYASVTTLKRADAEALGRVCSTLERSRYAVPASVDDDDAAQVGQDVRTVVHAVRQESPWNLRANAALLPRSGLDGIRRWFTRLLRR